VYAVDVGRGQIEAKLRSDPRVRLMEKTNARYLEAGMFDPKPDLGVVDVSFISLKLILPPLIGCLLEPFDIVALIKPQFELSPKEVPKGVVKDEAVRKKAIDGLKAFAEDLPVVSKGVIASPIKGAKGNVEFLWHLRHRS